MTLSAFRCRIPVLCLLALLLAAPARATSWFEWSEKLSSDDNIYSFVTPYSDAYWLLDLKANLKDKLRRTTHYSLMYNASYATYSQNIVKDYLSNKLLGTLEEDISESLVASLNASFTYFDYLDKRPATNYSQYDYQLFDLLAALRFYVFAFDFTSIDWGLQLSLYDLPNYNFSDQGFVASLNFLEEVAEYQGLGTFLTVKQALFGSFDLELTGKLLSKYCPERPLYAQTSTATQNFFSEDKRSDLETTLLLGLSRRFSQGSSLAASLCLTQVQSNANAQVNDPVAGVVLQDGYYNLSKNRLILDGLYCFGRENSFLRLYLTYTHLAYASRLAQAADGTLLTAPRLDDEYGALVEFNQRVGSWLGVSWVLKLGYQHTQNISNDYFYNFSREIVSLGLSSYLYL